MTGRIALYGDIDLNLVDGSSIWLSSLAQTLRFAGARVEVFLKAPEERRVITAGLRQYENIRLIAPGEREAGKRRLTPRQALDSIERRHRRHSFACIVLRGRAVCLEAGGRSALDGRIWSYLVDGDLAAAPEEIERIVVASTRVLCQTEEIREHIESGFPAARGKTLLLPPMIPECAPLPLPPRRGLRRMVYAGKFSEPYAVREMLRIQRRLREKGHRVRLEVYGDKFHLPSRDGEGFRRSVETALRETPGVRWHGAVPREELMSALPGMDLAWGWRRPEMKRSRELSTKVLEYGAAGLAVLLNRTPLYERLLGREYPLFAESEDEALDLLCLAAGDRSVLRGAAEAAHSASREHTFARVYEIHLQEPLRAALEGRVTADRAGSVTTVLCAGHDLRFLRAAIDGLQQRGIEVLEDRWRGHAGHDIDRSRRLLERADIVFCEWCLGNAVWYSRNARPDQRVYVRFHSQELRSKHPSQVEIDRVERLIFVAEHVRDKACARFGWPLERTVKLDNLVVTERFARPKLKGFERNLGMIGVCPKSKRLDRALDILEALRVREPAFNLYIKSRMPWEYSWLWSDRAQREYYEACFRRIDESPLLRNAVIFDPYGSDVPEWLRKIGFLLSVSDFEGTHVAVAEAAAAASVPVIVHWEGAELIYPDFCIHASVTEAVARIHDLWRRGRVERTGRELVSYARGRFDVSRILPRLAEILSIEGVAPPPGLPSSPVEATAEARLQ